MFGVCYLLTWALDPHMTHMVKCFIIYKTHTISHIAVHDYVFLVTEFLIAELGHHFQYTP